MPLSTGDKFGPYEILSAIGAGGMGEVYKARDSRLNRLVAIKVLKSNLLNKAGRKQRFIQEAQSASALNHPNIVTVHDIFEHEGTDFLVMELIPGKTLDALIPRNGLRLNEALRIAVQIAEGLGKAHAAGIIHRDIKPSNVIVPDDGPVKILDFGLAKLLDFGPAKLNEVAEPSDDLPTLTQRQETEAGTVMGTIAYMSPEQAEGLKLDARTDIFSFGALLYEMCCGRRAFVGDSKQSTISAILKDEPKPLENIPVDLEKIIRRCLRKDPAKRFQHMVDVKITLDEVREDSESGRLVAPAAATPRPNWKWLLAPAAIAILGGSAYWLSLTPPATNNESVMTQLTRDLGLTVAPTLSADGKLLAYASDRSGEGHLDIWVQQMAGGQPLRLTNGPGSKFSPTFSPDGTKVAFTNFADRTLSVVPALGGDPTVVTRTYPRNPHYSPDGSQIAVVGHGYSGIETPIYLLPATGGTPRKVETGFGSSQFFAWSPDTKTILIREWLNNSFFGEPKEIYAVPTEGGTAVPTGLVQAFSARGVELNGVQWLNGRLIAAGRVGDVGVIEEFHLQKDNWRLDGNPRRLLTMPGANIIVAATDTGPIVFSSVSYKTDVWSIPLEANTGKVLGGAENLTNDEAKDFEPTLSADGKRMVYVSDKTGRSEVWLRDLTTGKETQLTTTAEEEVRARISPDGAKIAYEVSGKPNYILTREIDVSDALMVCRNCSNPRWTPDSEQVTYWTENPILYKSLHLRTRIHSDIISHSKKPVLTMKFSPDGHWISFVLVQGTLPQVFISRVTDGRAALEAEWIPVTDGKSMDYSASWSPDAKLLYLIRSTGTDYEIVAQPLDPNSKHPKGGLIHVYTPKDGQKFLGDGLVGISLSANRLVVAMSEAKGNIWKLEQKKLAQ